MFKLHFVQSLEKLEATAINSTYFHNVTYVPGNFDNPSQLLEIKVNAMVMRNKTDCVLDICETVGEEGLLRFQLHGKSIFLMLCYTSLDKVESGTKRTIC